MGLNSLVKVLKQSSNATRITCVDLSSAVVQKDSNDDCGKVVSGSSTSKNDEEKEDKALPIVSFLVKTKLASETEKITEVANELINRNNTKKVEATPPTDQSAQGEEQIEDPGKQND